MESIKNATINCIKHINVNKQPNQPAIQLNSTSAIGINWDKITIVKDNTKAHKTKQPAA